MGSEWAFKIAALLGFAVLLGVRAQDPIQTVATIPLNGYISPTALAVVAPDEVFEAHWIDSKYSGGVADDLEVRRYVGSSSNPAAQFRAGVKGEVFSRLWLALSPDKSLLLCAFEESVGSYVDEARGYTIDPGTTVERLFELRSGTLEAIDSKTIPIRVPFIGFGNGADERYLKLQFDSDYDAVQGVQIVDRKPGGKSNAVSTRTIQFAQPAWSPISDDPPRDAFGWTAMDGNNAIWVADQQLSPQHDYRLTAYDLTSGTARATRVVSASAALAGAPPHEDGEDFPLVTVPPGLPKSSPRLVSLFPIPGGVGGVMVEPADDDRAWSRIFVLGPNADAPRWSQVIDGCNLNANAVFIGPAGHLLAGWCFRIGHFGPNPQRVPNRTAILLSLDSEEVIEEFPVGEYGLRSFAIDDTVKPAVVAVSDQTGRIRLLSVAY